MKKILITGVLGQVGYELQRTLAPQGHIIGIDYQEMDLSNPSAIQKVIRDIAPDIIVNPGAYTAVDKAESEQELCKAINATAPGVIAEEAKRLKAVVVHYSTDYVFDGSLTRAYTENETTNPLSVYGQAKLDGENAIRDSGCDYFIFRTSWVYGSRGKNFLLTMLKLAQDKDKLSIVQDQIGAPTWSRMIAQATAQILASGNEAYGTYNLTNAGKTSWLNFAETIFALQKQKHPEFKVPQLTGIDTAAYPTPAARPKNSLLCHKKLNETFGLHMPSWDEALKLCMTQ